MPQFAGANSRLVISEETTFGFAPPKTSGWVVPFTSDSLGGKQALAQSQVIRSGRDSAKSVLGYKDVSGSIATEFSPYLLMMMKHTFGTVVSTTSGSAFAHLFMVGALPTGLTLEAQLTDPNMSSQYFQYMGTRINRFALEVAPEGFLNTTFDMIGSTPVTSAGTCMAAAPLNVAHKPFLGSTITINEGSSATWGGGSTLAYVTKLSLSLDNQLDGGNYCFGGGGIRRNIPEGITVVRGELTALFESITLLQKAIDSTPTSLFVRAFVTPNDGTPNGTSGHELLEIFIPEMIYERRDPEITGSKGIVVTLPFSAYYDAAAIPIDQNNRSSSMFMKILCTKSHVHQIT